MKLAYGPENGGPKDVPKRALHAQRPSLGTAWGHGQDPGLLLAYHTRSTYAAHHTHPQPRVRTLARQQVSKQTGTGSLQAAPGLSHLPSSPCSLTRLNTDLKTQNPNRPPMTRQFPAVGEPTPPNRSRVLETAADLRRCHGLVRRLLGEGVLTPGLPLIPQTHLGAPLASAAAASAPGPCPLRGGAGPRRLSG